MSDDLAVIFAGGGTGGHLYPALAILQAVQRSGATCRANFVCSMRPLDAEILARESVEYLPVPAAPFSTSPFKLLRFFGSWAPSLRAGREAIRACKAEKTPVVVVGMGGFVAPPIVQAARVERVPSLLVNLDAVPGKANRWIARKADRVLSVQGAGGFDAIPPIVRDQAIWSGDKHAARDALGLAPDLPTLLITGGSQGAGSLDSMMLLLPQLNWLKEAFAGWQVLHQSRPKSVDSTRQVYERCGIPAVVVPYIDNIGAAWGAADVAIARAGAGAVAEVWANRVPTIFLPYPGHRDEHQRFNAEPLERAGGAVIMTDTPGMSGASSVGEVLTGLMQDLAKRQKMQTALTSLGPADGADQAAKAILELIT